MYATRTADIATASRIIAQGRVVAVPTGTSYGLAADALAGHALARVRNLKRRPSEKPISVFLAKELWDDYLNLSHEEFRLLERYGSAALTLLVLPKQSLAHLSHNGRIGLRVIDHPMMRELAHACARPLTATSANIAGQESAYSPEEVERAFPGKEGTTYDLSLGCILDGGELARGRVSTIAKLENGSISILRQGSLILA